MKRLFVLSLVAVLSVGLLSVGAFGQTGPDPANESDSTTVYWELNAPLECDLTLNAHANINLGVLEEIETTYYASAESNSRTVNAESNCPFEINLEVEGVTAPISGSDVLEDFEINAASDTNVSRTNNSDIWNNDWYTFSSYNDPIKLGDAGDDNYGDYTDADITMDYRYTTDYDDVNNETYEVDLLYTASTN